MPASSQCRDGWFLLNNACVESCPSTMTSLGISQFRRRCLEPFVCQNGRIQDSTANYGCRCTTDENTPAACQFCNFNAGESGQYCTRCLGGQYLWQSDNRCHANCDTTGLIGYNPGNYGRECRAPFTCDNRVDEHGSACKCSRAVGRNDCRVCDYSSSAATCQMCTNSKYLQNGVCVDECDAGSTPDGNEVDGRECRWFPTLSPGTGDRQGPTRGPSPPPDTCVRTHSSAPGRC